MISVIDVDDRRKVVNVIVSGKFGAFEGRGKKFCCKAKASVMNREYASFCAQAKNLTSTKRTCCHTEAGILYWVMIHLLYC